MSTTKIELIADDGSGSKVQFRQLHDGFIEIAIQTSDGKVEIVALRPSTARILQPLLDDWLDSP